jgi:hypothetical protein
MPTPATTSGTLANAYMLLDDTGTTAGPTGGTSGGGSGKILTPDPFIAPTLAAAAQVAYLYSSIFQRPVRLAPLGSAPPYTLIVGVAATVALTSTPSGITY